MKTLLLGTTLAVAMSAFAVAPLQARDRDRDDVYRVTPNQVVDMADARIAQLKADLRLNADQDKNWGAFQSALHDMAQRRADRMAKLRDQRAGIADGNAAPAANTAPPANIDPNAPPRDTRDGRDTRDMRDNRARNDRDDRSPDLVADMRMQADALAAKADDFRKFADASGPIYGSLDDGQKRRFIAFVQRNMMSDDGGMGR